MCQCSTTSGPAPGGGVGPIAGAVADEEEGMRAERTAGKVAEGRGAHAFRDPAQNQSAREGQARWAHELTWSNFWRVW